MMLYMCPSCAGMGVVGRCKIGRGHISMVLQHRGENKCVHTSPFASHSAPHCHSSFPSEVRPTNSCGEDASESSAVHMPARRLPLRQKRVMKRSKMTTATNTSKAGSTSLRSQMSLKMKDSYACKNALPRGLCHNASGPTNAGKSLGRVPMATRSKPHNSSPMKNLTTKRKKMTPATLISAIAVRSCELNLAASSSRPRLSISASLPSAAAAAGPTHPPPNSSP
mmetsp:Transcript_23087/g.64586  ORF Transcript_23087/g.64586 Transcript_23087/m.64586 type:complete len:224 (+) Transcript_23087:103-774(+)